MWHTSLFEHWGAYWSYAEWKRNEEIRLRLTRRRVSVPSTQDTMSTSYAALAVGMKS